MRFICDVHISYKLVKHHLIKTISENIGAIQKLNTEKRFLLEIDNEFILFVKEGN